MTPEQLLAPRYKVIADFPRSTYIIGEVVQYGQIGRETQIKYDEYTAIFKPLQWWEERKEEEMPQYIRLTRLGLIKKVEKWYKGLRCFDAMHEGKIYSYDIETPTHEFEQRYMPATHQEYLTYINSK